MKKYAMIYKKIILKIICILFSGIPILSGVEATHGIGGSVDEVVYELAWVDGAIKTGAIIVLPKGSVLDIVRTKSDPNSTELYLGKNVVDRGTFVFYNNGAMQLIDEKIIVQILELVKKYEGSQSIKTELDQLVQKLIRG